MTSFECRFNVGDKVKDPISNLTGKVVAITFWEYGCTRVVVQPLGNHDGKPPEQLVVDEPQLELVAATAAPRPTPRHGGRDDSSATRR